MAGLNEMINVRQAMDHLVAMQQAWRACPDGVRFSRLLEYLYRCIRTVISQTGHAARTILAPSTRSGKRPDLSVAIHPGTGRTGYVAIGVWVLSLDDVIHEYILEVVDRYLARPDFLIKSPGYILNGVALCAYTMLRSRHRALGYVSLDEANAEDASLIPEESEEWEESYQRLRESLWFHYPDRPCSPASWRTAPALSLRHCYAALRSQSGAALLEVAREIGVHPSRMTALKRELVDFFPRYPSGGFIPLYEFAGVRVAPEATRMLGLGAQDRKDIRRKDLSLKVLQWIRERKTALWTVYCFARDLILTDNPRQGSQWIRERSSDGSFQVEMRVEEWKSPTQGFSVLLESCIFS